MDSSMISDLHNAYKSNVLKERIQVIISNDNNNDSSSIIIIKLYQYISIQSYNDNEMLSCYISILRWLLMLSTRRILSSLSSVLLQDIIIWLCSIINNTTTTAVIKGAALSNLSIIIKQLPESISSTLDYKPIAEVVAISIIDASIMQEKTSSVSSVIVVNPVDIIIHQCVQLLEVIGSPSQLWLYDICKAINASIKLVSSSSSSSSRPQSHVDAAKLFGMMNEILSNFKVQCHDIYSSILVGDVEALLNSISDSITTGNIIHDSYLCAFQGGIDLLHHIGYGQWTNAFLSSHVTKCTSIIDTMSMDSILSLKRMESIIGLIDSVFYSSQINKILIEDSNLIDQVVSSSINSISLLQNNMKISLKTNDTTTTGTTKDRRTCCADIRKGSITLMENIILVCPQWVACNQDLFWDISVKSLSTPLLFAVAYKVHDNQLTARILKHLHSALNSIDKYSITAAIDVITSIRDLCEAKCIEIFTYTTNDVPLALVKSYSSSPRMISSSSSQSSSLIDYKIAVGNAIKELCILAGAHHYQFSNKFVDLLTPLICSDMVMLYKGMGTFDTLSVPSSLKKEARAEVMHSFGTIEAEYLANMLNVLSSVLIAYYESNQPIYIEINSDEITKSSIEVLIEYLYNIAGREVIFEDDIIQVCTEIDLIGKIVISFVKSKATNSRSIINNAIGTICRAGIDRFKGITTNDSTIDHIKIIFNTCRETLLQIADELNTNDNKCISKIESYLPIDFLDIGSNDDDTNTRIRDILNLYDGIIM